MKRKGWNSMHWLVALMAGFLAACASMGRPDGGPRDVEPPLFVKSNPTPGSVNIQGNRIVIEFDENIQLDNPMEKVVVSPAQRVNPQVTSNGRRVTVELRDSLLPNTTYTIDFADAIKDLNEGNVLDGFAIDFSTGPTLDSLRISGMVFEASNLEPAQGMLVGAYLDRGDTAIATTRFDRITKTNQLGQFTLRNLKPGAYRIYALRDNNRDYHWDRTEDVAFLDSLVTPWAETVMVADSVVNPETGIADSVVMVPTTAYFPNDIILTWFNENYQAQYLKEYSRPDNRRLQFRLGAPTDTLPRFRMLNGPLAGDSIDRWARLTANPTLDSLVYWIHDERVLVQDSILLEANYQRLDSTERLVWATDTLRMFLKPKKDKKEKDRDKKKAGETDSIPQMEFLSLTFASGSQMDLNKDLVLTAQTPIERIDTTGIRMEMLVDTVWTRVPSPRFSITDSLDLMTLRAPYTWEPATKYRLTVDSAAVADIYGLHNKLMCPEFSTRDESDYSALFFVLTGVEGPAFVELLNGHDGQVARADVVAGEASLTYINPGTYYARLVLDSNANGRWDTGNLLDSVQPEEVYYYPRSLNLKKNWDVEQSWDIYATPLDLQKPVAIKKNKPAMKAGEKPLTDDNADEIDETVDEWGNYRNPFEPDARRQPSQQR